MKTYNHTVYAILGILTTDCRTGYSIKQLMDKSLTHFWKVSYGQIYPTLKLLVREGLADVQAAAGEGKPDKLEYSLTAEGKNALKNWLEQPIAHIPGERNEVLLKLFFGRYQTHEATVLLLQQYQQKLEDRQQTYKGIEQVISRHSSSDEEALYWLLTLDYGQKATEAAIEWCASSLEKVQKLSNEEE